MNSERFSDFAGWNSEEFAKRLDRALNGEKPTAFAKRAGLTASAFMKYFNGSQPGLETAIAIAKTAGVSLEWLATGRGPMRTEAPSDSGSETSHVAEGTQQEHSGAQMIHITRPDELAEGALVLIPRIAVSASAGAGTLVEAEPVNDFVAFAADYLRRIGVNPRFAKLHEVRGDSMMPTLVDGEWVIIDTSVDHIVDEGLYTVGYGGVLLVKRIRLLRDGGLILVSDNKAAGYEDEIIRKEDLYDLHVAGRVRGHFRFT